MRNGTMVAEKSATDGGATSTHTPDLAFEELFRLHQRAVYGWILRIVRNHATAEDLTIETFWRIHRSLGRFDQSRQFEPWARKIATHAALDWLRVQRPVATVPDDFFAAVPSPIPADPGVAAEIRLKVAQSLGRLPPKLRVAANLTIVEELPRKQVAEALGVSVAAVKLRVFRALRLLRKDLREQGITP
jgi:RNA polymerase sigma-70 factor (ECF subfamily)